MTSRYVYAKKNTLSFRVLKLKKQVLKMYNEAQRCHKNYPNVTKDEITLIVQQILEAKHCVDGVESCFTESINSVHESDIDLELVMENGSLDYKKKADEENLKLCVKKKKIEKVESNDENGDSVCAGIGCVDILKS